jgi:hypothetical protein
MEMSLEAVLVAAVFSVAVGVFFGDITRRERPLCSIRLKLCVTSKNGLNP